MMILYIQRMKFSMDEERWETSNIYDRFEIVKKIGNGANCIAYEAISPDGSKVVISEFLPYYYRSGNFSRDDSGCAFVNDEKGSFENEKTKFIKEYLLYKNIQNNNRFTGNNRPVLYCGGNTLYNVMSFDGEPVTEYELRRFIIECKENNIDYVKVIFQELKKYAADILSIHENGNILLDIKPANFIMTKKGLQLFYRRIIDYGSCENIEHLHHCNGETYSITYSDEFAAPETKTRDYELINTCSDLFSFGKTVLYFLTGNPDISSYFLTGRSMADFKQSILYYDKFGILETLSDQFILQLRNFADLTLSYDINQDELTDDEIRTMLNETRARTIKQRVKNMKSVISMLEIMVGYHMYPEFEEQHIRMSINKKLDKYRKDYYGLHTESEKNKYLFSDTLLPIFSSVSNQKITSEQFIETLLTQKKAFYIEGPSGCGKSTFIKYTACKLIDITERKAPIPIYIKMTDLILNKIETSSDIFQYLAEQLFNNPVNDYTRKAYFEEFQRYLNGDGNRASLVLFFDGVNEISHYKNAKEIVGVCQSFSKNKNVAIVFSGQDQKLEHPDFEGSRISVQECTKETVSTYLDDLTQQGILFWHPSEIKNSVVERTLNSLKTPMLAHCFAARFYKIDPIDESQLPINEAFLIEEYLTAYGTNCAQERIQAIFSPERITVIPYAQFLMYEVLGKVCLDMAVNYHKNVSDDKIRTAIENSLCKEQKSDKTIRKIGDKNISDIDYEKMIAIYMHNNSSWLSQFFISCSDHEFEILHSSIGIYLAAKYLIRLIRDTNEKKINSFPKCIWRSDLPEELLRMTAMLISYNDIYTFCRKFKKRYGGTVKRFLKKQINDLRIMSDDRIILENNMAADFDTAGHNIRRLINVSELSERQKRKLKRGIPDNKIDSMVSNVFSSVSNRELSKNEKNKLGYAAYEIGQDPQALYLIRFFWQDQPDLRFKNKISVFLYARRYIEKLTEDFLENQDLKRSEANDILDVLFGYRTIFPEKYTKHQLIEICARQLASSSSHSKNEITESLNKLWEFLENTEIFSECSHLIYTFGAITFLRKIKEACKNNQYAEILKNTVSEKLLHEISFVACSEWNYKERNYYPERYHASLIAGKNDAFRQITQEKQDGLLPDAREIEKSNSISLLIRQFCLVEYEIHNTGDHIKADTGRINALAQLYVLINYAVSKKSGRMLHTKFSLSGNLPIVCDNKEIAVNSPDLLNALIALEIFDAVSIRGILKFSFYYIKDFRYVSFIHLNPKYYIFFILFGIIFVSGIIIRPLTYIPIFIVGIILLIILSAGWGVVELTIIICKYLIYKALNLFIKV